MSIRRISRPSHSSLGLWVSARRNGRLQFRMYQTTRSISTIPVTTSTSPIPSKYPDPQLFTPKTHPKVNHVSNVPQGIKQSSTIPTHIVDPSVPITLYAFPSFAPLQLLYYPATHLHLPLRRDLLHRAITFEGDACHPSTVWTPHRKDHPGSGRKIRPQKGTGMARLGDSSSPALHSGIKAFGPKPRDMSTDLPRKMYDRAWRTALSWRYKKGELVVVNRLCREDMSRLNELHTAKFIETFNGHSIGSAGMQYKDEANKPIRTTWIVQKEGDEDPHYDHFVRAMSEWWPKDKVRDTRSVDVKNLLEGQRVVIEEAALNGILKRRQSDLPKRVNWEQMVERYEADAESMQKAVEETKKMQAEMEKSALETIKTLRSRKARKAGAALSETPVSAMNPDAAHIKETKIPVEEPGKS